MFSNGVGLGSHRAPWWPGDRVSVETHRFLLWDLEEAHREYCRRRKGQLEGPTYHGDTLQEL
jgi:hypothetical protein